MDSLMIENGLDHGGVTGAVSFFMNELQRGPFAPALAGEPMARFGLNLKFSGFARTHLPDCVVIASPSESPVARPAVALKAKLNDPAYWRSYRLQSFSRVWEDAVVDLTALNSRASGGSAFAGSSPLAQLSDAAFLKYFVIGRQFKAHIARKTLAGNALVAAVEVDGKQLSCLIPVDGIPAVLRVDLDSLVGADALVEVSSALVEKRSVWLRLIRLVEEKGEHHSHGQLNGGGGTMGVDAIKKRLQTLQALLAEGFLSQDEYDARRVKILDEI